MTAGYFYSVTIYVLLSWTVPGFQAAGPDQTLCMVCLARNIKITVRWIPSEFNSSDRGSREHDNAHDATNSVVDHLGSRDGQALAGAHTSSGRAHSHREAETLATSDGVPFDGDLLPGSLEPWQKKREDSVRLELGGDRIEWSGGIQPPHDKGQRQAGPASKHVGDMRPQRCRQLQRRRDADHRTRSYFAATQTLVFHRRDEYVPYLCEV